ncbi:MAG: DNA repair protein RecN [Christensenellales bacterium]|jgi:DNA repair protein RecN (Recombination protein N)
MLYRLSIWNVAIIEHVDLSLDDGLNVLTGETGAGKSILIDAISLILGSKADKNIIRAGSDSARVEAVFCQDGEDIKPLLMEMGIPLEDEMVVTREIGLSGRSVCRVNGHTVTVNQLRTLMAQVADIHGQQESYSLTDVRKHRDMVDAYGGVRITNLTEEVKILHQQRQEIKRQLSAYDKEGMTPEQRIDILEYQILELENADVQKGEEDDLLQRRKLLQNTERIIEALQIAVAAIDGGEAGNGALADTERAASAVGRITEMSDTYSAIANSLDDAAILLEDVQNHLRDAIEGMESEGDSLENVEERLHLLRQLSRKYGCGADDLPQQQQSLREELDALQNREKHIAQLREKDEELLFRWKAAAKKLTHCRKETGNALCVAILRQMADLGMENAGLEVEWTQMKDGQTHAYGNEEGQFYITINPGEPMRPLNKVASGGELSRIMLAIKAAFAGNDGIQCQIFDEIDAGVSGNMALVTAQKLAMISRRRQILCVTHLPQIAAMADVHYKIEKIIESGRAATQVERLPENTRYQEVARLIGSSMTGETGESHAKGMVDWCNRYKSSMIQGQ